MDVPPFARGSTFLAARAFGCYFFGMPKQAYPLPTATAAWSVRDADLADQLSTEPGDAFPPVFATSRMIALMEIAAARALHPLLEPGELSVGVKVDVHHTAPTPPGATVTATARFIEMAGKLYRFEIDVRDDAGEIGRGTHERAIVHVARLVDGASKRQRT
ncbi:thioesterase family protein [Pendulispora albinea]|uniref:Fluoroacetyl-CoA-specific thioesterase-like domain-containing protein n=1 Tax=Pendulispora albinea TaxID=2741071 RepID=A0ABZ2LM94_9BACT